MADPSRTGRDTGEEAGAPPTTGMPRWVKAFLIVVGIAVVVAFVVSLLAGVQHGPGLHTP